MHQILINYTDLTQGKLRALTLRATESRRDAPTPDRLLLDRTSQVDEVKSHLGAGVAKGPSILLLHGAREQGHDNFVRRTKDLLKIEGDLIELAWPDTAGGAAGRYGSLLGRLDEALNALPRRGAGGRGKSRGAEAEERLSSPSRHDPDAMIERIRGRLIECAASRDLFITHRLTKPRRDDLLLVERYLREVLTFDEVPSHPVVMVFATEHQGAPKWWHWLGETKTQHRTAKGLVRLFQAGTDLPHRVTALAATELKSATRNDVSVWFRRHLDQEAGTAENATQRAYCPNATFTETIEAIWKVR